MRGAGLQMRAGIGLAIRCIELIIRNHTLLDDADLWGFCQYSKFTDAKILPSRLVDDGKIAAVSGITMRTFIPGGQAVDVEIGGLNTVASEAGIDQQFVIFCQVDLAHINIPFLALNFQSFLKQFDQAVCRRGYVVALFSGGNLRLQIASLRF